MRTVLKLECIGDNYIQHARLIEQGKARMPLHTRQFIPIIRYGQKRFRVWVAKIVDGQREFVTGMRDYSLANSIGSRGVFEYFALDNGIYEVNECIELGKARRYFIQVKDTAIEEICPINII
jgi:hypothetical protein